jgi:hypothetical protein
MTGVNQNDDEESRCEQCLGTCNDKSMQPRYPIRPILWRPCPVCKGSGGRKPKAPL